MTSRPKADSPAVAPVGGDGIRFRDDPALFRLLVENAREVIWVMNLDGTFIYHSPSVLELRGYTPEEANAIPLSRSMTPQSEARVAELLAAEERKPPAERFSGSGTVELELFRKDGATVWSETTFRALRDGTGCPVAIQGSTRDISQRRHAEEALRRSEERYKRITGTITDYVYTVRVAGGKAAQTTHGPGCHAVTGYEDHEFGSDPHLWLRMVVAGDRPRVEEQARRVLTGETPPPLEHRIVRKDGEVRWVRNTFVLFRDEFGALVSYDGLIQDITERRQAEEALRQSERRFRTISMLTSDIVYSCREEAGPGFHLDWMGGAVERITGYSVAEILERGCWAFLVADGDQPLFAAHVIGLAPGATAVTRLRLHHKHGKAVTVESNAVCIGDEEGGRRLYGSLVDISERQRLEAERLQHREQLFQADKMATLGILVAGVAHEINNPNNFIMMNADIISRAWEDVLPILERYQTERGEFSLAGLPFGTVRERFPSLVEGLQEGTRRIRDIVTDLKEYAVPDRGGMDEEIDVNRVLNSAIHLTRNLIQKCTTRFESRLAAGLPPVRGSVQRLEQVFINVIQNACQALTDPRQAIEVSSLHLPEVSRLVVVIRDQGRGMDADGLKHIADPFFTTRREIGGTGLGISICQRIVEDHGGDIRFESEVGRGMTVTVSLPAALSRKPDAPPSGRADVLC